MHFFKRLFSPSLVLLGLILLGIGLATYWVLRVGYGEPAPAIITPISVANDASAATTTSAQNLVTTNTAPNWMMGIAPTSSAVTYTLMGVVASGAGKSENLALIQSSVQTRATVWRVGQSMGGVRLKTVGLNTAVLETPAGLQTLRVQTKDDKQGTEPASLVSPSTKRLTQKPISLSPAIPLTAPKTLAMPMPTPMPMAAPINPDASSTVNQNIAAINTLLNPAGGEGMLDSQVASDPSKPTPSVNTGVAGALRRKLP